MANDSKLIFEAYQESQPKSFHVYTANLNSMKFPTNGHFAALQSSNLIEAIKEVCAGSGKKQAGFPTVLVSPDHFMERSTEGRQIAVANPSEPNNPLEINVVSDCATKGEFFAIADLAAETIENDEHPEVPDVSGIDPNSLSGGK